MTSVIRDDDGEIIKEGDFIWFSYGIPLTGVKAKVALGVDAKAKAALVVLTPDHNPKSETLKFVRTNFNFWKVKP